MYLIVDGYNMIGAWKELGELAAYDLGAARDKLHADLLNYCGFKGYRLLLVFDAHLSEQMRAPRPPDNGMVFTTKGETADNYIERFVRDNCRQRMIVATSDSLVQVMVFAHASRMSARELQLEVKCVLDQKRTQNNHRREVAKSALEDRLAPNVYEALDRWRKSKG